MPNIAETLAAFYDNVCALRPSLEHFAHSNAGEDELSAYQAGYTQAIEDVSERLYELIAAARNPSEPTSQKP